MDDHEELLFTDLALFNRKLADWLGVSDDTLGQRSPLSLPTRTSTRVSKVLHSYMLLIRRHAKGIMLLS